MTFYPEEKKRQILSYMHASILCDERLSDRDVVLFNYILSVTGGGDREFYQSVSTIATSCFSRLRKNRSTETSISKSLNSLCLNKYLIKTEGGFGRVSTYKVDVEYAQKRAEPRAKEYVLARAEPRANLDTNHAQKRAEPRANLDTNHAQNCATIMNSDNEYKMSEENEQKKPLTHPPTHSLFKNTHQDTEPQQQQPTKSFAELRAERQAKAREEEQEAEREELRKMIEETQNRNNPPPRDENIPEATQVPAECSTGLGGQKNGLVRDVSVGSLVGVGAVLGNLGI